MNNEYFSELEKIGSEITKTVSVAAHQYGPQTIDLVLGVERVMGLEGIIVGILFLILASLALYVCLNPLKHTMFYSDGGPTPAIMLYFVPVIGYCIALGNLLYVWNWVAVFYPQVAIAHDIIVKLTSTCSNCVR